jgi:hypothetical protein
MFNLLFTWGKLLSFGTVFAVSDESTDFEQMRSRDGTSVSEAML